MKQGKVHYISPYRADKNIGRAINESVRLLDIDLGPGSNDWIIHTDQDVCFLRSDTKAHIEQILMDQNELREMRLDMGLEVKIDYDILGCLTNRVGFSWQCVKDMWAEDSISRHVNYASTSWADRGKNIWDTQGKPVAAFLLCFRASLWKKLAGFDESALCFDSRFCDIALRSDARIGVMTGIYVLHLYRWGLARTSARHSTDHLIPREA